jgi:hypothetical protein
MTHLEVGWRAAEWLYIDTPLGWIQAECLKGTTLRPAYNNRSRSSRSSSSRSSNSRTRGYETEGDRGRLQGAVLCCAACLLDCLVHAAFSTYVHAL